MLRGYVAGSQIEKIYVVKMGEVVLTTADGKTVSDPGFVKEAGGFTFFGDSCLEAITRSPYAVSYCVLLLCTACEVGWYKCVCLVEGVPGQGRCCRLCMPLLPACVLQVTSAWLLAPDDLS
jgi:hypothetical protein